MGKKIALSSSWWNCPAVDKILIECEKIYTSNVDARDQLYEKFGCWRVEFVAGHLLQHAAVLRVIVEDVHPGAEFINRPELRKAWEDWIVQAGDEELVDWFGYFGYKPRDGAWHSPNTGEVSLSVAAANIRRGITGRRDFSLATR